MSSTVNGVKQRRVATRKEKRGVDEKFLISRPDSSSGEAMFNVLIKNVH